MQERVLDSILEMIEHLKQKIESWKYKGFIKRNRKTTIVYLKDTNLVVFKIVVKELGESYDVYERVSWDSDDDDFYQWRKVEDYKEKIRILGRTRRHKDYRCYYHPYMREPDIQLATPRCQYEFEKECLGFQLSRRCYYF